MWYRDAALVAARQQDLENELRLAAAARAAAMSGADHGGSRVGRVADGFRVRSAAGIRRLGEAAIGLSRRIDVPECDGGYGSRRGSAIF